METLSAADGSRVVIRPEEGREILETRDARGRLVFEYDSSTGRGVLYFPGMALSVRSENGSVELSSSRGLRLRSAEDLELIGGRGVRIDTPQLEATATEARFSFGRLEQTVGRFFQFARDFYQRIESLLHTRAGRIRTEAGRSYHVQAGHARIQAKEEVELRGRQINLG